MLKLTAKHQGTFVTVDDVKASLRVTDNEEILFFKNITETACQKVQEDSGKALNEDTFDLILPCFSKPVVFPVCPVKVINSVSYFDSNDAQQTISVPELEIESEEDFFTVNYDWPETFARKDAVTINFTTGIPSHLLVPENLRHAAILLASHYYENRSATGMKLEKTPMGYETLINQSKIGWF